MAGERSGTPTGVWGFESPHAHASYLASTNKGGMMNRQRIGDLPVYCWADVSTREACNNLAETHLGLCKRCYALIAGKRWQGKRRRVLPEELDGLPAGVPGMSSIMSRAVGE